MATCKPSVMIEWPHRFSWNEKGLVPCPKGVEVLEIIIQLSLSQAAELVLWSWYKTYHECVCVGLPYLLFLRQVIIRIWNPAFSLYYILFLLIDFEIATEFNLHGNMKSWKQSSPSPMYFAGGDKSIKQWKCIRYWSPTTCHVVCIALWEGKPCATDAII